MHWPNAAHAQAIQYYYETLHYLQTALQYHTYTQSEEILATAIIISTYEMLDESASNWQRHLKGVFWIQRSQNVNGGSGGLRQAVWWAWLRQDIWAAFRERRKCHSFWQPVKSCSEMTQPELADQAVYLLSQAVNYVATAQTNPCGDPASDDPVVRHRRIKVGDELLGALERWDKCTGRSFQPLPTTQFQAADGKQIPFEPIWIHPPNFAVAMMVYNFAKILLILYRPTKSGFNQFMRSQVGVFCL